VKKLKTVLKIAIVVEVFSIPVLAFLISNSSCKNNGTDCGLAGFGALYMVFPLILTILLYVGIKFFETTKSKSGASLQKTKLRIFIIAAVIFAVCFELYIQSTT
jgi:hypothetical protein